MTFEIVTVVKNDLVGFLKTQESIKNQNFKFFSWHVIDGSNGPQIREKMDLKIVEHVRYSHLPPMGIYNAMNFGISASRSEWIWFLNAGDLLADNNSTMIVEGVTQTNSDYDAVGFTVHHIDSDAYIWGITTPAIDEIDGTSFKICSVNHQGFIARSETIKEIGGFDESLHSVADSKMMDEFANSKKIFLFNQHLVDFTLGGHSSKNFRKVLDELETIRPYSRTWTRKTGRILIILKHQVRNYVVSHDNSFTRNLKRIRKSESNF